MNEEQHEGTQGFLSGGGQAGAAVRALDWSRTGLGRPSRWPQSLRTAASLVLGSEVPMWLGWGPGLIQIYNDAFRERLGAGLPPNALGAPAREVFSASWDVLGPQLEAALRGDASRRTGLLLRAPGRPDVPVSCACSPVRDEAGEVGGVLLVSGQEADGAALHKAGLVDRGELRLLLAHAPVFISLMRGPEHHIELANDAAVRLTGRALQGRNVRDALPELEGQGFFEVLDRVHATGESFVGVEMPARLRGRTLYLTFTWQAFRDADGAIAGVASFGADVTEMVEARRASEQALQKAELAERRKDEFLAMLGHELRNPLAPIVTAVQLMKLRQDPANSREQQIIERQVMHLSRLVDDLLDVSRIARGKIELRRRPLEASELVARAIEMASPLLEQRHQQLALEVPRHGLLIDGDPTRLSQVLANLLTNAAKYTPPHGQIVVSAVRDAREVELRVRDNGIGIAPDMLPHIFDLFVQSERSLDRAEGGLGLGLSLVKNLVMLHGGSVSCSSGGLDAGSEFVIRLPALDEEEHALRLEHTPPPMHALRARRVLVVDDNEDAAATLAEVLRMRGHEVEVASDGPAALELLSRFHVEVGLLDLGLPVMDGFELARRMREVVVTPLRLIAVTGYGQENDRVRTSAAGFDVHLVKPVELDAVTSAVEE